MRLGNRAVCGPLLPPLPLLLRKPKKFDKEVAKERGSSIATDIIVRAFEVEGKVHIRMTQDLRRWLTLL